MGRRALTDKQVAALSAGDKRQREYPDGFCPGLLLRVYGSGRKVWDFVFRYPSTGKRARMWIGLYPAVSLAQARQTAMEAHAKLAGGKDPRIVEIPLLPKTVAELIEDRLELVMRGKKRTAAALEHRAHRYIIPIVGAVPVKDFRIDPHYNAIIDPVLKRGSTRMAGVLFQDLRALMNFGIQRGVIEYSRIAKVKRPDTPAHRTRYLTLQEIKTVWVALPLVMYRSHHIPTILRLCLTTGQRLGEVSGMRRAELDLTKALWTIPGSRTKNKHEHVVPLSTLALELIGEAMRRTNGDILFPDREGDAPLSHRAIDCAVRNAQQPRPGYPDGKFGIPRWKPHDLRRTVGTQMSRKENGLQIPRMDRAHIFNHRTTTKETITDEIYDQNDFLDEKRAALDAWGTFLQKLLQANIAEHISIAAE